MLRTWVIAGIAVAASTGPTLGQDAAAGEQVFKRLCSPCHEIGQGAKIKLGPPLNGIDGRKSGTFEGFNYSPANKSSGITFLAGGSVHHGVEVGISAGRVKQWHAANRRIRHHSPANSDSCSTGWPNTS